MTIAEDHQRFLQRIQLDFNRTSGFISLMMGIGVAGGKKFCTGFRKGEIEHAAAQGQLFAGELP
ncbi:hypothetical protein SERRSCBI_14460 [Serratia sp. SCBI]|nr:hypothetical protein SERRSCBI_14460 [Serratia sp. SCBI]